MSDGPHRSLSMSRSWKRVAGRLYNEAYGPDEVRDALLASVKEDWDQQIPGSLADEVQNVLSDSQTDLFYNQEVQQLESLRRESDGYPLAGVFLDYVVQAVEEGFSGGGALLESARRTVMDLAARRSRQIEEHYYREPPRNGVADVRQRSREAIGRLDAVAIAHLLGIGKSQHPRTLAKHTGLDDGVLL